MLSNNDGCAMGRSAAAKGSGIPNGFFIQRYCCGMHCAKNNALMKPNRFQPSSITINEKALRRTDVPMAL
jgi:hypothetical protein